MTLSPEQLDQIASTKEVLIETRDGDQAQETIIWVVVDDGDVFIRSFRGQAGRWYRQAIAKPDVDLIVGEDRYRFHASPATDRDSVERTSAGFRLKYGKGRSVDAMVLPGVLDTTLRLIPDG
ncbi:MAG: DUF2255 family protein [Acidimicrobiia bacterium]